jgi:hypothetical protein
MGARTPKPRSPCASGRSRSARKARRRKRAVAQSYTPTKHEQAAIDAAATHIGQKPHLPKIVLDEEGCIGFDHPDQMVAYAVTAVATAAGSTKLMSTVVENLATVTADCGDKVCPQPLNRALALVHEIEPADAIEAMLAVQMVAVHDATIRAARVLKRSTTIQQQDSASNMLNKLGRTFTAQIEALKRHRSAGEQTVRVEHVHVYEGGQAVVGNVNPQGGGDPKYGQQPYESLGRNAASAQVQGHVEAKRKALPSPGGERLEGMSVPRGKRRSANGTGERRLAARAAH